jgi:hypothetical protein
MIGTIEDALRFYEGRTKEFEAFGSSTLRKRLSPLAGLEGVVRKLGLPKDYAECADRLLMENVSLGYFELCPVIKDDLCASLEQLNGEERNLKLPSHLLHVAAFEADIIAVAKDEPYHKDGAVFFVDITTSPDSHVRPIAKTFGDFIVLASALDQMVLEENDDPEGAIANLAVALLSEEYAASWEEIAGMVV